MGAAAPKIGLEAVGFPKGFETGAWAWACPKGAEAGFSCPKGLGVLTGGVEALNTKLGAAVVVGGGWEDPKTKVGLEVGVEAAGRAGVCEAPPKANTGC